MQSLNKAQIIGFLPRNPEMRYTASGTPVTSFTLVSLRPWVDVKEGDKKSPEYTNIVAWNKLAEICNQLLGTGSKVFVEGRVQTRNWDDEQGNRRYRTEIVAEDMVVLGDKHSGAEEFDIMQQESSQTLNRIQIIGNLTRDPEKRELPSGTLLTTFGVATNRTWVSSDGNRQEGVEYHNIICWNEHAQYAADKLKKGMKIFAEGRLQNRTWETPEGTKQNRTEIVAATIIISSRMPAVLRESESSPNHTANISIASSNQVSQLSSNVPEDSAADDEDVFSTPSFVTDVSNKGLGSSVPETVEEKKEETAEKSDFQSSEKVKVNETDSSSKKNISAKEKKTETLSDDLPF